MLVVLWNLLWMGRDIFNDSNDRSETDDMCFLVVFRETSMDHGGGLWSWLLPPYF